MSRAQQDSVIDDDEETCPLCIEEFDLSDKNFKPCPCGYQICQFCFNSLKTTYEKSTCPNCRRVYDEKTIQYKVPTAEEFKLDQQNKNRKQAAAKRKETEKREVETSSRRNLAGVRVKQQNLVYVIGLVPSLKDENSLLQTLRGVEYFGQYGDIDKIVVSKAKAGASNQGIGVYVTFARKEDAALCISMVDGSMNGDRVLRAQFGTTKYCSAYLRGEACNNKSCTFLHETGEDGQNTTIQNEPSTTKPAQRTSFQNQITQVQATNRAVPPAAQTIPLTSQPMHRQNSKEESNSRQGSTDASALPSTASWGNANAPVTRARPTSQAASRSSPSPQISNAALASQKVDDLRRKESATPPVSSQQQTQLSVQSHLQQVPAPSPSNDIPPQDLSRNPSPKQKKSTHPHLDKVLAAATSPEFRFVYDDSCFSPEVRDAISRQPPPIDPYGGVKRRAMREKEAAERAKIEAETLAKAQALAQNDSTSVTDLVEEETFESGSLALGGEPEDNSRSVSARNAIQRPTQQISINNPLHDQFSNLNINPRSLTPQQRQQLALLGSANIAQAPGLSQPIPQVFGNTSFDGEQRSGLFQNQPHYDPSHGHARQSSRYSFVNESTKSNTAPRFTGQQHSLPGPQHFYTSGAQGPPPGLKTAGTPPISGGGMFAQGYGFTSNINPGFGNTKDVNTDMLMRGRSGTSSGHDISKRGGVVDLADPSVLQARLHQSGAGSGQGLFGGQNQDDLDFPPLTTPSTLPDESHVVRTRPQPTLSLQDMAHLSSSVSLQDVAYGSSTPKIPPGLSLPHAHPLPPFESSSPGPATQSKPLIGTPGPVTPAVPLLPIGQRSNTPKPKPKSTFIRDVKHPKVGEDMSTQPTVVQAPTQAPTLEDSAAAQFPLTMKPSDPSAKEQIAPQVDSIFESTSMAKIEAGSQDHALPDAEQKVSAGELSRQLLDKVNQQFEKTLNEESVVARSPAATPIARPDSNIASPVTDTTFILPSSIFATPSLISSRPNTPATAVSRGSDSSAVRPRTIRVTTSMLQRTDATPASATTERSIGLPASAKQHSRQPSISSIFRSRPSTPAISDHGFSNDVSRASSPPPSIVGSATERTKTRSQLRKERKAKAKESAESKDEIPIASTPAVVEEIAPIISRQKKKKRPTQNRLSAEYDSEPISASTKMGPDMTAAAEAAKAEKKYHSTKTAKPLQLKDVKEVEKAKPIGAVTTGKDDDKNAGSVATSEGDDKLAAELAPKEPYTLNQLITYASKLNRPGIMPQLLEEYVSSMKTMFALHLWKDLDPNSALFGAPPLSSYRLPPDPRKGAEYLDGNGYTQSSPFGIVYLSNKERKLLKEGLPVRKSDANRPGDLLRRVLITPKGTVLRHLTKEEEDRVLELEAREKQYMHDYGQLGKFETKALEEDDFINLLGGLEELYGARAANHGISWVTTAEGEEGVTLTDEEGGFGGSDNLSDDGTDDRLLLSGGYHAASALGTAMLATHASTTAANKDSTGTIGQTTRTRPQNLRAMDLEKLGKKIRETREEIDRTRKEVDMIDKKLAKKAKEALRWKESMMRDIGKGVIVNGDCAVPE